AAGKLRFEYSKGHEIQIGSIACSYYLVRRWSCGGPKTGHAGKDRSFGAGANSHYHSKQYGAPEFRRRPCDLCVSGKVGSRAEGQRLGTIFEVQGTEARSQRGPHFSALQELGDLHLF